MRHEKGTGNLFLRLKAFFLQDFQVGDFPVAVDGADVEFGLVAVFALVDVAPVADGAGYVPACFGDKAAVLAGLPVEDFKLNTFYNHLT